MCLAIAIAGIVFLMLPPSEKQLRQRAEKLLATNEPVDWNDARDSYLQMLIERFPDGENADWAHEQIEIIEMKNAERKIERNARSDANQATRQKTLHRSQSLRTIRRSSNCLEKYTAIVNLRKEIEEERPYVNLARRQIKQIQESPPSADELRKFLERKLEEANAFLKRETRSRLEKSGIASSLYNGNRELKSIVEQAKARSTKPSLLNSLSLSLPCELFR